ncbi:MAG: type IV pilus modification protein PilV [Desulfobacteraceae bacterium]|nr:type IV pilus modification protein PilV [Desulfobacteraceae bacterium]MBC2749649.1 type IV pilus modification protein PilV [Desulfobacteraceae bacterium]
MKRKCVDNTIAIMQRSLVSDEHGFSLIEVLIAVAILAIGLLAIGRMQVATVRNTTNSNTTTQAVMLAHQKMEEIKNTPDITDLADEDESNLDANGNAGGIYTRRTRISNPPNIAGIATPTSDFAREVEIQVEWTTVHGGNRTITLNSITHGGGI